MQAHRLSSVIECGPRDKGALPRLIVDGRMFTWDQNGRMMMTFEGFTLNAIVKAPSRSSAARLPMVDSGSRHRVSRRRACGQALSLESADCQTAQANPNSVPGT